MVSTRDEVPLKDRWNVEAMYPSLEKWEQEFKQVTHEGQKIRFPSIEKYKGKLGSSPSTLKEALETMLALSRNLEKLYTYAHLKHDEDITQDGFRNAYARAFSAFHDFQKETSWFEPELLSLPEKNLSALLKAPELSAYRFHLEKVFRQKPHTLSSQEEHLMAMCGKALQASQSAYRALTDADLIFGKATDSQGLEHEMTHALYSVYLRNKDRILRKNAFETYHHKYRDFENTINELITGQVETYVFNARARKFNSSLEAALHRHNIPTSVYHSLVETVNKRLPSLHRYMNLRKEVLGVEELHLYDMHVPLTSELDMRMPYEEAMEVIADSVAPLGDEYQTHLRKGLNQDRWVDRYENKNKRSGGYSSGCFDSMPYILMNYKDIIRDVFTLAHEGGHSMHSLYSRQTQPYHYADYSIFVAEVASTFNEELLTQELLKRCRNPQEKIFLINQKLEDIRGTLFRQTMFAEFELKMHQLVEQGTPLTPKLLNEEYFALNQKYFGKGVVVDQAIGSEWARIPHFYYNFYVYQYATGISAALSLAEKVVQGGKRDKEAYLNFLKGGCSQFPIDLLKMAGVDMTTPQPVEAAINRFDQLIDELESLMKQPAGKI